MNQLPLVFDAPPKPLPTRFAAFVKFHRDNPVIYRLFERFAREARAAGRHKFGARMIGERIRWYVQVETTDTNPKLNDHYWPYYARLLMIKREEFAGFFERRDNRFDATDEMIQEHCR